MRGSGAAQQPGYTIKEEQACLISGRRALLFLILFLERSSMWVDLSGQGVTETWLEEVDVVIIPSVVKGLEPTRQHLEQPQFLAVETRASARMGETGMY